jgi:hypothetical protein
MKLTEDLRAIKGVHPAIEELLETAAQRLEDQRLWREAWLNAENKVELLTSELSMLRLRRQLRKEKECND